MHCVATFDVQNTDVFQRGCFLTRPGYAPNQSLDAEKVFVRMTLGQFAQERAVTAAKINLRRRGAAKDREQIKRRDVRLRDQFDHGTKWSRCEAIQPRN